MTRKGSGIRCWAEPQAPPLPKLWVCYVTSRGVSFSVKLTRSPSREAAVGRRWEAPCKAPSTGLAREQPPHTHTDASCQHDRGETPVRQERHVPLRRKPLPCSPSPPHSSPHETRGGGETHRLSSWLSGFQRRHCHSRLFLRGVNSNLSDSASSSPPRGCSEPPPHWKELC